MKHLLIFFFLFFLIQDINAQEITKTNTDIIFKEALKLYKEGEFEESLKLTEHGLALAREYHDIRILQVRNLWALENFEDADEELAFLLKEAPGYAAVKPLAQQRVLRYKETSDALSFLHKVEEVYPDDPSFRVTKAQLLLNRGQKKEARSIAMEELSRTGITGEQRYAFQIVLNRSVTDEIGITYQVISFSEDYPGKDTWHGTIVEYQHNFNRTAVIGRVNYSNRSYGDGVLYELEAYPVFNDRWYAYTNIGFSDGSLFPDFRSSVSIYHNFANVFEGEVGGRSLHFHGSDYFTGILGLSMYEGKFLFNARTFLGPERKGHLIRNYQANVRYYLSHADNYLSLRIGSGISPDERAMFSQVQEKPTLEAYYLNLGIRHIFWNRHIFQLETGFLHEDITSDNTGNQLIGTLGYRFRF